MKTKVILAVVVLASALGNVALSYGMKQVGDISALPPVEMLRAGVTALFHPWVAAGVALLIVFFLSYTTALSWADLSYVLPSTAAGYVLVAILSRLLLHESLNVYRWAGTALIAVGVLLVARTEVRTT
jgi:drug/metabolite transporter (DMT)-like permease